MFGIGADHAVPSGAAAVGPPDRARRRWHPSAAPVPRREARPILRRHPGAAAPDRARKATWSGTPRAALRHPRAKNKPRHSRRATARRGGEVRQCSPASITTQPSKSPPPTRQSLDELSRIKGILGSKLQRYGTVGAAAAGAIATTGKCRVDRAVDNLGQGSGRTAGELAGG